MEAGWTLGFQPDGRELLIVAIKGTFSIPANGEEDAPLTETQVPLTESDEFTGEPGLSAPLYESDYAHRKPLCDVLLNGSAYTPGGQPAKRVTVALRVGSMKKSFNVIGDRVWRKRLFSAKPSRPKPFTRLPITYDRAFGGVDVTEKKPDKVQTYLKNPIGVGYYPLTKRKALVGKPLPNTEEIGNRVKKIKGKYQPMSFGPIGRNFESRIPLAGTYDQDWLDHRTPFFPNDFDYRYFQAAPADQQIPYPRGGEEVVLENLTPEGITKFRLPMKPMPILFISYQGKDQQLDAVIDTVVIEPDQCRFMLTWRASLPLRRNCFELEQVVVGKTLEAHRRETAMAAKPHYASLAELVRANKRGLRGR
jgi:hypothetical protein